MTKTSSKWTEMTELNVRRNSLQMIHNAITNTLAKILNN